MSDQSDEYEDQDSEPTMTAPKSGRPDGIDWPKDDDQDVIGSGSSASSGGSGDEDTAGDGTVPQRTDAEAMESQEEERPSDE